MSTESPQTMQAILAANGDYVAGRPSLIKLEGKNAAGMLRLQDALEDHDDVQSVYSNFDIDEKELEALSQ